MFYRKISQSLEFFSCSEIWLVPRQHLWVIVVGAMSISHVATPSIHCCRDTCQISKQFKHFNTRSHTFETYAISNHPLGDQLGIRPYFENTVQILVYLVNQMSKAWLYMGLAFLFEFMLSSQYDLTGLYLNHTSSIEINLYLLADTLL